MADHARMTREGEGNAPVDLVAVRRSAGRCQAGGGGNAAPVENAGAVDQRTLDLRKIAGTPEPDPAYVPAANDASGDNAMTTAIPEQVYYRDLPAARLVRGDWTVKKAGWFAVSGNETASRAAWREAAFAGAHIRIDRQKIHVTLKGQNSLGFFQIDCAGIGYLGKYALVESERRPSGVHPTISREDVMRDYGIAVAEKELVQAYPGAVSTDAYLLSVLCPESPNDERMTGGMTGVLLIARDLLAVTYSNGVTLFATRDRP